MFVFIGIIISFLQYVADLYSAGKKKTENLLAIYGSSLINIFFFLLSKSVTFGDRSNHGNASYSHRNFQMDLLCLYHDLFLVAGLGYA